MDTNSNSTLRGERISSLREVPKVYPYAPSGLGFFATDIEQDYIEDNREEICARVEQANLTTPDKVTVPY